jgi:hypothetical protein
MAADFVRARLNISGAQSYHNSGGMILYGPGAKDDRYEPPDVEIYRAIGKKGEEMLPGYRLLNIAHELYEVHGGEVDWLYAMQGIYAFTNELFTSFNLFRKQSEGGWRRRRGSDDRYRFDDLLLLGEGLVKWKEFDHPQYGRIEVGGMKKNWGRQPPSFLLEEECHRNMAFTLYHADQMPLVEVQDITVKDLGRGLKEVTAVVANPKVTPTRAAVDVKHGITPPDRITIKGAEKVIAAVTSKERFFREPREQKRKPHVVKVDSIRGMGAVYVRWIVKGEGPFTVRCVSVKGGTAEKSTR